MPYKDPSRKRQWEREHHEERNARRRRSLKCDTQDFDLAVRAVGRVATVRLTLGKGLSAIACFRQLWLFNPWKLESTAP
jgi:hypothetical protein